MRQRHSAQAVCARVEVMVNVRVCGADEDTIYLQHTLTEEPVLIEQVATVVLSQGHDPVTELAEPTGSTGPADRCRLAPRRVHLIGDWLAPRTVEKAVLEGFEWGRGSDR